MLAKKAIIAGASGLIGSNLLQILLAEDSYAEVLILVRRELPISHKKLVQLVIDFDDLDKLADSITGHALFCCLGTTRNQTPDKNTYRKIDHDYPLTMAQLALKNNVKQYHLISAIGADENASSFYLKLKGETEKDIIKVGLPALHIYRPSLLTGRKQHMRVGERIATVVMKILNPLLTGGLKKYRSIPATDVAMAMYNQSIDNETGTFIYQYNDIKQ